MESLRPALRGLLADQTSVKTATKGPYSTDETHSSENQTVCGGGDAQDDANKRSLMSAVPRAAFQAARPLATGEAEMAIPPRRH